MSAIPLTWYCPGCGLVHSSAAAAARGYACPVCERVSDHEARALACCGWEAGAPGYRAIRAALEAQGQTRLAL